MSLDFLEVTGLLLFGVAIVLSTWRLLKGPTTPDRIVAGDTLNIIATAGIVLLAALFDNPIYLDVALIYGVLSFVGTVALARTIEARSVSVDPADSEKAS
jgi:multicomponent Na+:H+ antiporter subunit F